MSARQLTRAEALADLILNPHGSVREWAKRWGWHRSSVDRFLKSLVKSGALVVEKAEKTGTSVSGVSGVSRPQKRTTETLSRESSASSVSGSEYLDNTGLLDVPRYGLAPETPKDDRTDPVELIEALNRGLTSALGAQWIPISTDNRGSLTAAIRILAKVPGKRAIELVEQAGRIFNPSQSGGAAPRSLGHPFFTRYVSNESKRIERAQAKEQLELLPQVEMKVEHSTTDTRPSVAPEVATGKGDPAPVPLTVDWREAFAAGERSRR